MSGAIRKNFASDNTSPVCPEVMAALARANEGDAMSYGNDPLTKALSARLSDVFEAPVAAYPVATGTAANSLTLSALTPPFGAVLCDESAHIATDEGGAPEFFTHGAKLLTLSSADGRMDPDAVSRALTDNAHGGIHTSPIRALSLTQATEWGTVYPLDHLRALTQTAHDADVPVHLDGARLSNAIVHLGCSPADVTWRAGVDVMTLGGTKNGAMAAEAIVFFHNGRARAHEADFLRRIKRSGHLWSKQRYVAAQMLALYEGDLWRHNATAANETASLLATGLAKRSGVLLPFETQSNEVFAVLPETRVEALEAAGYVFYRWPTPPGVDGILIRLVTCFATTKNDVAALLDAV
ncbi:threonine aldolase family protein [Tanticharoenia sakaeratensis]|uniref:L-threonine aldolase n=1 Tax=Tanticharoenia sakaeratensis NBRC 103193 TaxID=1231623 RepID=A0A0D6MI44_9PROT|nr:beta-eliminating lyase-related protein [Tanticharoenia sakaeratensis]GAN53145.1 low-specificity threonine aldolase [Tanticharoenia sakaeratensis NBRC 103193]